MRGRPTWVEIDLEALRDNYAAMRRELRPGSGLMAVVKANAYGHGAVRCAKVLEEAGADWLGVALPEEGHELRRAGIASQIFCLGGFWRGQAEQLIDDAIVPAIFRLDSVEELESRAAALGKVVDYHLKVDTGLGRLGVPESELADFARQLVRYRHARLAGLLTHFAEADGEDGRFTRDQIAGYHRAAEVLRQLGFEPRWRHMANSAGIHAHPDSHGNLARSGAALYGLVSDVLAPHLPPPPLRPVMSLRTRIIMLKRVSEGQPLGYGRTFFTRRQSVIATLPIGYADGLPRVLSNNGRVLVAGEYAPIVGRVSMDLTLVDVTDIPDAAVGAEVVVIGEQRATRLTAEDLARCAGTISYEIVTGIGRRVDVEYLPSRSQLLDSNK